MMIADVIREAQTEQEIFQLLNAYIEAGGGGGKPSYLLEDPAASPSCANDVMQRCLELMSKLDVASRQLDDTACAALKEALHVFSNALSRLKLLEREKHRSLAGYAQLCAA
jgi:hypothetical protein